MKPNKSPCPNCKELNLICTCLKNKYLECGNPVYNKTFTVCDECWSNQINQNTVIYDAYCPFCEAYIVDERVTFEEYCDRCKTPIKWVAFVKKY